MKQVILLLTLLSLSACSKLTLSNYDQLKAGMSYREVMDILGNADHCEDLVANRECIWGSKDGRYIQVNFVAGAAVYFNQNDL